MWFICTTFGRNRVVMQESWTHGELKYLTNLVALGPMIVPLDEGGRCASPTQIFITFEWQVWKIFRQLVAIGIAA